MINENCVKKFCSEDISLIENYDLAVADQTQTWHCHHRREISEQLSKKELISRNEYFGVLASELIFLTKAEHQRQHRLGKHHSDEVRAKISFAEKGKHLSVEHRAKMSIAHKGKCFFNNGQICIRATSCPKGFVHGRLKRQDLHSLEQLPTD